MLREARKQGVARVDIGPDGTISVWLQDAPPIKGGEAAIEPPVERETIIGKPDSKGKNLDL